MIGWNEFQFKFKFTLHYIIQLKDHQNLHQDFVLNTPNFIPSIIISELNKWMYDELIILLFFFLMKIILTESTPRAFSYTFKKEKT